MPRAMRVVTTLVILAVLGSLEQARCCASAFPFVGTADILKLRGGGGVISRVRHAAEVTRESLVEEDGGSSCEAGAEEDTAAAIRQRRALKLAGDSPGLRAPTQTAPDFTSHTYDYDLIVIGGGSGGLACSKQAAALGGKVAVFDYVDPTPKGTRWGLGGTCVNVGCIPKKLMHRAAHLGEYLGDAAAFGWKVGEKHEHDWKAMVESVQNHICSLNFGYTTQLRGAEVTYLNAKASFIDPHTIEGTDAKGRKKKYTAAAFVIAVGGRPKYPGVPGEEEHCITSDDLFSLKEAPGKTLVVGASYVALECAGFISGLGHDAAVMMRSIPLRGFDKECSNKVVEHMEKTGTRFIRGCVPVSFAPGPGGKGVKATFKNGDGKEKDEAFDTVILAIGRYAVTEALGLDKAGVDLAPGGSGKIASTGGGVGGQEQTSADHIFAIGDVLEGRPELTPVAIKAGQLLAKRLFGKGTHQMDYDTVATTVFTPLEYSVVGLSEEEAIERYGEGNFEVYYTLYRPLEWSPAGQNLEPSPARTADCYAKVLVLPAEDERIIGIHMVGEHTGEIMQGFALAVKLGAKKADLDALVGIHPTSAEVLTSLTVTKSSGTVLKLSGC